MFELFAGAKIAVQVGETADLHFSAPDTQSF